MSTKYIDLDEISEEQDIIVIRLKGKEHPMQEATVETFIQNLKDLENLGMESSPLKELEVVTGLIKRIFPTITDDDIKGLSLPQLRKIQEFGQTASGEIVEQEKVSDSEEGEEAGNAPEAS